MDNKPKYVTEEAISKLVKKLDLPAPGEFSQDWEYIVADKSRILEFLSFYENQNLDEEEKFALMIIIIASFNDLIEDGENNSDVWVRIEQTLKQDMLLHENTIEYWALMGENLEDCFAITPHMRRIKK